MNLLHKLLNAKTEDVFDLAFKEVSFMYTTDDIVTDCSNYLVFHGTNPVALVAHIDTVKRDKVDIKQKGNVIKNSNDILGADDRAGVYGIIQAARKATAQNAETPTLIFTNGEECGGIGVSQLINDKALKTAGINLFVEMDRKGCNEFVFYSWELPKAIKKYARKWGFVENYGTYSDISNLTDEYCIPAINVSCGYYDQHTSKERLHVDELEMNINRVVQMLKHPMQELHKIENAYSSQKDWMCCGNNYYERAYERAYGIRKPKSNYTGYNKGAARDDYRWADLYPDEMGTTKQNQIVYDADELVIDAYERERDEKLQSSQYYGDYDLRDMRDQLRVELLADGYISLSWELVKEEQHAVLQDMEDNYSLFIRSNPHHPEDIFEMVWDEAVSNLDVKTARYAI